ncbi:MAG: hypothetical protein ABSE53_06090 [Terracidiphilus sp.]|jgi:hypothetical protein
MGTLTSTNRCPRKSVLILALLGAFTLAATPAFAASPGFEKIRATYAQAGNTIGVTLVVYNYTTSTDLQVLSLAFQQGQDRQLAAALSKTKAVGHCSIAGDISFDVAFIQMVVTPTGREITFIANRPLQSDEVSSDPDSQSFDLMVGQFEINDTDNTKSTGFLYLASRLVVDEQGAFHYDLAGSPWSLVNVLDSNWAPAPPARQAPDATGPPARSSLP